MRKVVYLQVYVGKELLLKQNGKVSNQNQTVTLEYPTQEWDNYMKHISTSGFCKVDVFKVKDIHQDKSVYTYTDCDNFDEIKEIVKKHHVNKLKKPLSKEQIEINELKKQVKALLKVSNIKKDDSLDELKAKYKEQEGKDVPVNKKNNKEWIKSKLI